MESTLMINKTYRFTHYYRTSIDPHSMETFIVEKTWSMPTQEQLENYARYEAGRTGAFKYEEITHETQSNNQIQKQKTQRKKRKSKRN